MPPRLLQHNLGESFQLSVVLRVQLSQFLVGFLATTHGLCQQIILSDKELSLVLQLLLLEGEVNCQQPPLLLQLFLGIEHGLGLRGFGLGLQLSHIANIHMTQFGKNHAQDGVKARPETARAENRLRAKLIFIRLDRSLQLAFGDGLFSQKDCDQNKWMTRSANATCTSQTVAKHGCLCELIPFKVAFILGAIVPFLCNQNKIQS